MDKIKVYAVHKNDIPTKSDALYVILDDESDLPQDAIQVDAVDLLPKNYKNVDEVLFLKTGERNFSSNGEKVADVNVYHVNSIDDIEKGGNGVYILDDIKE